MSETAARLTHGGEDRRCECCSVLDVVNSATVYASAVQHVSISPCRRVPAPSITRSHLKGCSDDTGEQYAGAPPSVGCPAYLQWSRVRCPPLRRCEVPATMRAPSAGDSGLVQGMRTHQEHPRTAHRLASAHPSCARTKDHQEQSCNEAALHLHCRRYEPARPATMSALCAALSHCARKESGTVLSGCARQCSAWWSAMMRTGRCLERGDVTASE